MCARATLAPSRASPDQEGRLAREVGSGAKRQATPARHLLLHRVAHCLCPSFLTCNVQEAEVAAGIWRLTGKTYVSTPYLARAQSSVE